MSAFIGGLKDSLKLDQVTSGVASKLNSAKEFIQDKQHSVSESSAIRSIREKVGQVVPQGLSNLNPFGKLSGSTGLKQSPINIVATQATFDPDLANVQFDFCYYARDAAFARNTGSTLEIVIDPQGQSTVNAPGLLGTTYKLSQIQCHWGSDPHNGSEHLIGGLAYAAEMHLIHVNSKYLDYEEATKHPDGLAIFAIFLAEGMENPSLDNIVRVLNKVPYTHDQASLQNGFDIRRLLPERQDYWTYEGSLTTPPFPECAVWIVYKQPISISAAQLNAFRSLYAIGVEDAERNPKSLQNNVRPVQELNGRSIRCSFQ